MKKALLALLLALAVPTPALASDTCPNSDGYIKVDNLGDDFGGALIEAPAGQVITNVCVKAATELFLFTPNTPTFVVSEEYGGHDASHYSYRFGPTPDDTPSVAPSPDNTVDASPAAPVVEHASHQVSRAQGEEVRKVDTPSELPRTGTPWALLLGLAGALMLIGAVLLWKGVSRTS